MLLRAIQLDQPLYQALVFEPGVWEPGVSQVASRLDHRLTVDYGRQGHAHLVLPDLEALSVRMPEQELSLSSTVSDAEVPVAIQRAVRALVEKCGFSVMSWPDESALIRTISVERSRPVVKSSRYGAVVSFTYGVDIKGTPVTPCYEG